MTSKERAGLRAKANALDAVFQIGKGGLSQGLIAQTEDALKARELIKLKVLLETSPDKPRQLADSLAQATGAEVVQVVGGSIVLFKVNPELHKKAKKIVKPLKKKRVNTISKPRIARGDKPAGKEYEHKSRKPAADRDAKAYSKQDDKKTAHKPLHKGRPRSAGKFKAPTKKY